MKKISCRGKLGDAYGMVCKLYDVVVDEIDHYLHKRFRKDPSVADAVKEIFSLLPSKPQINIVYYEREEDLPPVVWGTFYEHDDLTFYEGDLEFNLPDVNKFNLPSKYNILQIKGSIRNRQKWRELSPQEITETVDDSLPLVIIGRNDDTYGKHLEEFEFANNKINLINSTSVLEGVAIIKNASNFYGPVGLWNYVSVSFGVKTHVFLRNKTDVWAMSVRIEQVPKWKKNVIYIPDEPAPKSMKFDIPFKLNNSVERVKRA